MLGRGPSPVARGPGQKRAARLMGRDGACGAKAARHSALTTWREVGAPASHWEQCYHAFARWPDSGFPRPPRPLPPKNHFKFDPRWSAQPRGIDRLQLGTRSQCLASSPAGATPQFSEPLPCCSIEACAAR